jgi:hypothetical protein
VTPPQCSKGSDGSKRRISLDALFQSIFWAGRFDQAQTNTRRCPKLAVVFWLWSVLLSTLYLECHQSSSDCTAGIFEFHPNWFRLAQDVGDVGPAAQLCGTWAHCAHTLISCLFPRYTDFFLAPLIELICHTYPLSPLINAFHFFLLPHCWRELAELFELPVRHSKLLEVWKAENAFAKDLLPPLALGAPHHATISTSRPNTNHQG